METAQSVDLGEAHDLLRQLALLFPGYAGDRQDLLATLTEEELNRARDRLALDADPDRVAANDPLLARLHREHGARLREAFQALSAHVRRGAEAGRGTESAAPAAGEPRVETPRIIAVGGAKGGVGKSTLAASLSAALARMGHRVVAVDMDLGGADLHLFLGIRRPQRTLGHFWANLAGNVTDLLQPTGIETLSLIGGDSAYLGSANIRHAQKQKLIRRLRRLPARFVVLDLGGDTSFNTLDFFLLADQRLVVTTLDPASVLEGYNLIKVGLLRSVTRFAARGRGRPEFSPRAEEILQGFADGCGRPDGPTLPQLLSGLEEADAGAAAAVRRVLAGFRPKLILNQSGATNGKETIQRIREVCRLHLQIEVELCHLVPQDANIPRATHRLSNVISARSEGAGARALWALASKIAAPEKVEAAEAEAEAGGPEERFRAGIGRRPELHSRFFQPPWIFPLLPRFLSGAARRATECDRPLQAWFLGGGSGEGPYSLAITLEEMGRRKVRFPYAVWVPDCSAAGREQGARGVYPRVFLGSLRTETLRSYFAPGVGLSAGFCRVKEFVRGRVTFAEGAGVESPAAGASPDLVFAALSSAAFAALCRGPFARMIEEYLAPGGLLVVPYWPGCDLPLGSFRRLEEGIFRRES